MAFLGMRSPIRFLEDDILITPAPNYGEHTREVLMGVGFTEDIIDQLLTEKIIKIS